MIYVLYAVAALSALLAVGGFSAYAQTRRIELLLSSIVSIGAAAAAVLSGSWWPLVAGFTVNWVMQLAFRR